MAGSDDKPEDKKSEDDKAKGSGAAKPAARSGSRKASAAKSRSGKSGDTASKADDSKPSPVKPEDAPSGDSAKPGAKAQAAAPQKAGPAAKGASGKDTVAATGPETKKLVAPTTSQIDRPAPNPVGKSEATSAAGAPPSKTSSDAPKEKPADAAAQPARATAPQAQPQQGPGFFPLLLGGLLAGGIGFLAAWYMLAGGDEEVAALLTGQDERITELEGQVGQPGEGPTAEDLSALEERLAAAEAAASGTSEETQAAIAAQSEAIAELAERMDALERAPVEGSEDPANQAALEAYGREVEALREEVAAQMAEMNDALQAAQETEAEAAAQQEEAAAAAARAREQQALLEVQQALESGAAYGEPLGRISTVDVSEGLAAGAADGVPTLDTLKAEYPQAARDALRVAREETASDEGGGLGSWVTRQLGARSLEPKEGADPDAVLSRAEAALNGGDLGAALDELAALPPGGQEAMAEWMAMAERRHAAVTGAEALSETLASNQEARQ